MNNNEIVIEAFIYHGPGCCSKCGGPIIVADSEVGIMELNQDGIPISEETIMKIKAVCSHCGEPIDMMRWQGGYVPYSENSKILKYGETYSTLMDRISNINKNNNPFSL